MKKVYQTKFGKPEGNCFPACLASILEIDIDQVPNFHEGNGVWYKKYREWFNKYDLSLVAIMNWEGQEDACPQVYAIVGGLGPRGLQHSTVYFGLDMVHDPHPEGGGVKDITEWIYLVPKFPKINQGVPKCQKS